FCGRKDNQVKIRGVRVELEDIEAWLMKHEAVSVAVVLLHDENEPAARLVGYIVPKTRASISAEQLTTHLQSRLPQYMVPSTFVMLDRIPLSPNGKADRKKLRSLAPKTSGESFVAARTATEELLLNIWREILKRDTIGIRDNFFRLGGHSLLVTRVVSRVKD